MVVLCTQIGIAGNLLAELDGAAIAVPGPWRVPQQWNRMATRSLSACRCYHRCCCSHCYAAWQQRVLGALWMLPGFEPFPARDLSPNHPKRRQHAL